MPVRVAINGFGRIGRNFLRAALASEADLDVVALNDLASIESNAHLLRYDSSYGRLAAGVEVHDGAIKVGRMAVRVLSESSPELLPWRELGVDVVIESTGRFTSRDRAAVHLGAGAKRVIISAPAADADTTLVMGVNDMDFDPDHHFVVSNASCTTNCFVPMVKVLDDAFGVRHGLMTTVHAYTNDQNLLDLTHKDLRRSRAAAVNIVPASTGAARATSLVLSAMKGRLDGTALRVPVPVGSITDFTALVVGELTAGDVNEAFRAAALSGPLEHVLDYTDEPVVSSDIVGSPASCTFDSAMTMTMNVGALAPGDAGGGGDHSSGGPPVPTTLAATLVKVFGWYDNEWGYSNRLVDAALLVGGALAGGGAPAGKAQSQDR